MISTKSEPPAKPGGLIFISHASPAQTALSLDNSARQLKADTFNGALRQRRGVGLIVGISTTRRRFVPPLGCRAIEVAVFGPKLTLSSA